MDVMLLSSIILLLSQVVHGFYCPPKCHCVPRLRKVNCYNLTLTEIPRFDASTLILSLKEIWISALHNDSFTGLPELRNLTLKSKSLNEIDAGVFEPLRSLHSLELSANEICLDKIELVFCYLSKTIERLQLQIEKGKRTPKPSLFRCLKDTNLTALKLNRNNIDALPDYIFADLTKLQYLFLRGNGIVRVHDESFTGLKNLIWLDLRNNHLSKIPNFGNKPHRFVSNLRLLSLAYNGIVSVKASDFIALKELQRLDLGWNLIQTLPNNMFQYMPKLRLVFLQHQRNLRTIEPRAFTSNSLRHLDISVNRYPFSSADFDVFSHAPHLHELFMYANRLDTANTTALGKMFRKLTELKKLLISGTRLTQLPTKVLSENTQLRELQLTSNLLSCLDAAVFQSLTSLKKLYLNINQIRIINETSLPKFVWENLTVVNMAGNPFACTCDNMWFREWVNTTRTKILQLHHQGSYACFEPKELAKSKFLDWHPTESQCNPLPTWVTVCAVCVPTILLLVVAIVISYRYRWYARYWCFTLRSRYKRLEPFEDDANYVFDAFVSYNCHDRHWVIQKLLPKLEYDAGLKLCLHDRDFIVGRDIVDNIVDGIEVSRKTILVLSDNFARSQWCQLEMTMAQHKLFDENKDILVLILLDDIKAENLSNRLAVLLRKQTYIEWPVEEDAQQLFWERLQTTLQRPH